MGSISKIGCYSTKDNVDNTLKQYKELFPNSIIKVFQMKNKRIWKYWVGTNESYLMEINKLNKN